MLPRVTVTEGGVAEIENEFTTIVTLVEWVRLPLVPVIVSAKFPVGVVERVPFINQYFKMKRIPGLRPLLVDQWGRKNA